MKLIEHNDSDITNEGRVILDFYANWCGPCKNISKSFKDIEEDKLFDDLLVLKINIDQNTELANKFNVRSLPTLIFLENGNKIKTKVGSLSKAGLSSFIRETYEWK